MTQEEWLEIGIQNKWCSAPFCNTHDGGPLTDEEVAEFDEGYDPCIHHVRLYEMDEDAPE